MFRSFIRCRFIIRNSHVTPPPQARGGLTWTGRGRGRGGGFSEKMMFSESIGPVFLHPFSGGEAESDLLCQQKLSDRTGEAGQRPNPSPSAGRDLPQPAVRGLSSPPVIQNLTVWVFRSFQTETFSGFLCFHVSISDKTKTDG